MNSTIKFTTFLSILASTVILVIANPTTTATTSKSSLTFKSGGTSISVSGGGWNKVKCETTSRPIRNGETVVVKGNKYQVGVGLCIGNSVCGIRFNHDCVGFYGDNRNLMFAADSNRKEYKIPADNMMTRVQGIVYDKNNNCVRHRSGRRCVPLPSHFKDKELYAIGQVWNSASANLSNSGGSTPAPTPMPTTSMPTTAPSASPSDFPTAYPTASPTAYSSPSASPTGSPLTFKSGGTSISVSGGGWNKVKCETTSRPIKNGETVTIRGNKYQVGVGLCIGHSVCGIRFNHDCVGFYGDNAKLMFAADSNGKEYKILADNRLTNVQGIVYDKTNNCVRHRTGSKCIPLPSHFKDEKIYAIGQVWNSASASLVPPPITFKSGGTSISVSGGGWNKVKCETTSRPIKNGERFTIRGNKYQVGVGLCIGNSVCGIRFNHDCVGFYGDNRNLMFAADSNRKEYKIPADNMMMTNVQGIIYDKNNNCVRHRSGRRCVPLPSHFKDKELYAIGQVWNSASATIQY